MLASKQYYYQVFPNTTAWIVWTNLNSSFPQSERTVNNKNNTHPKKKKKTRCGENGAFFFFFIYATLGYNKNKKETKKNTQVLQDVGA